MTEQEIKENLSAIATERILKDLNVWPIEGWAKTVNFLGTRIYYSPPWNLYDDESKYSISLHFGKLKTSPYIRLNDSDEKKIKDVVFDYMIKQEEELQSATDRLREAQEFPEIIKAFGIKAD